MKHHFGDSLDRDGGYLTVVPNPERYAYRIDGVPAGSKKIRILTIGAEDDWWRNVFTFPNLEELTLHSPSLEQLQAISALSRLKRLRITNARPKDINFVSSLSSVEELVLEYVSGFSDLSPLRSLSKLKSLHIENLKRVSNFGGSSAEILVTSDTAQGVCMLEGNTQHRVIGKCCWETHGLQTERANRAIWHWLPTCARPLNTDVRRI